MLNQYTGNVGKTDRRPIDLLDGGIECAHGNYGQEQRDRLHGERRKRRDAQQGRDA